jgi:predicted ATPase
MVKYLFTAVLLSAACTGYAQSDTVKKSPVRTLTYQQYNAYLKGEAANDMAMVAEMNHYPMPDKVLKLRSELDLSPVQIKKIEEINTYMHRRRLQIGGSVISTERTLDSLFRTHKMDDGTLIFYTNRYGLYQGELKNAILQACLATQKVLNEKQLVRFEALQKR